MNDLYKLEDRLDWLERRLDEHLAEYEPRPYYLLGKRFSDGAERHIAVFSTEEGLMAFVDSCRRKRGKGYKKGTPLDGFDSYMVSRDYRPDFISLDPSPMERGKAR